MSDENGWKFQLSLKIGQHMLNVRADTWEAFQTALEAASKNATGILDVANTFSPSPPVVETPVPAPQPVTANVGNLQPGEIATSVRGVIPQPAKQKLDGSMGKPFTQILFGDGQKVNVFDTEQVVVAQAAMAQNRLVGATFVQKGQFKNLASLRLLGPA